MLFRSNVSYSGNVRFNHGIGIPEMANSVEYAKMMNAAQINGGGQCSAEGATEWGVSFGIALQNIPEGMVIIAPLMMAGVTAARTFFISIFIALLEVIGILLGFGLGSASSTFLPVMLGFAGGAMLYVTSDEMIPETHAHGFQKQATYALLLGFITFVLMEKYV